MSKLQRIDLTHLGTEIGFSFSNLEPFLRLGSVSTFEVTNIQEDDTDLLEGTALLEDSGCLIFNTEYLTLNNCHIDEGVMSNRLRQFPYLKKLSFPYPENGHSHFEFMPPFTVFGIEHLKTSLEELQFYHAKSPQNEKSYIEFVPIRYLVDFEVLVSIDVDASVLMGVNLSKYSSTSWLTKRYLWTQELVGSVPKSLEYLSIRDCKTWHVPHIFKLVAQSAVKTPLLKTLNLHWERSKPRNKPAMSGLSKHLGFSEIEAEDLLVACSQAGIKMVIVSRPPEPKYVNYYREWTAEEKEQKKQHSGLLTRVAVSGIFYYPYDGYEECCKEHNCDPVTGRQM